MRTRGSIVSGFGSLLFFVLLLLGISYAHSSEQASLGKVSDVLVSELPYFERTGKLLGVVKSVNSKDFIGKPIVEEAPRGLIGLEVNGELRFYRSIHFSIMGGPNIGCPEVLQSQSSSTQQPVVSGVGKDCDPVKS